MEALSLKPAAEARWDLVSLGEVMLRFDPGEQRISRARSFRVWEGGGEYNVARALRRCFGCRTSMVTALVDNPLGRLVEGLMLEGGVDLSHLRWADSSLDARNGMYFLERGYGIRSALGVMDRRHTAISQLRAGEVDWDGIFGAEGARWFHTGGILCALSPESPALAMEAMQAARRHGGMVSFDCNYRPSLWAAQGGRQRSIEVNRSLMPFVDVLFGHEGDLATTPGADSHSPPWHDEESFSRMTERVQTQFPNIKVVATTLRRVLTATRNDWSAFASIAGQTYRGIEFPAMEILDRVGGGDAFAAGLIYGLLAEKSPQWALDCGVAHGALAMTTPGDSSMATLVEVERVMSGAAAGVQR